MKNIQWSNTFSFIITTTGAVVGLGNLWKFPYEAGQQGGAVFILLYIAFMFLLGIPMLIGEMLIGRTTQLNPVDALKQLAHSNQSSPRWYYLGWFGAITLLLILVFYSIVAGWICYHAANLIINGKEALIYSSANQTELFKSPLVMLYSTGIFLCMTGLIVGMGLHKGLERLSMVLMPLLLIGLLMLSVSNIGTSGFHQTVLFMFDLKWHQLTAQTCLAALGHAFFTLAIGAGAMLTYGSYLSDRTHLPLAASIIAMLNLLCALLSGFAFFPILFNADIPLTSGTTLLFEALPRAIKSWPYATSMGAIFYSLLLAAAVTSSVSLVEPWVALLKSRTQLKRLHISMMICLCGLILAIPAIISLTHPIIKIGKFSLFDGLIAIVSQLLLPIGALLFTVFAGWVIPKQKWNNVSRSKLGVSYLYLCCRFIAPFAIAISFLGLAI